MATFTGTAGNDLIGGTPLADNISGLEGDDTLLGEAGNDRVSGGPGGDTIYGWSGADTLIGGSGNDTIFGDADSPPDDPGYAGDGSDTIYGGTGNEFIDAGGGNDWVSGGDGDDIIHSGYGNSQLFGDDGNDTLSDYSGSNRLSGGIGDDSVSGVGRILGGSGNDFLNAAETSQVNGGTGADLFVASFATGNGVGRTITIDDFRPVTGDHLAVFAFDPQGQQTSGSALFQAFDTTANGVIDSNDAYSKVIDGALVLSDYEDTLRLVNVDHINQADWLT